MKRFDKEIKNKIDSFESPVASDLWSKIETRRAVNELEKGIMKKSSKVLTIILIATLLISGGIWSYYQIDLENVTSDEIKEIQNKIEEKAEIQSKVNPTASIEKLQEIKIEENTKDNAFYENPKKQIISNNIAKNLNAENNSLDISRKTYKNTAQNRNGSIGDIYNKLTLGFSSNHARTIENSSLQTVVQTATPIVVKDNITFQNFSGILPTWPHFYNPSKKLKLNRSEIVCGKAPKNYPFTYYVDFGFSPERTVKYLTVKDSYFEGYAEQRNATEGFHFAYALNTRLSMVHYTGLTFKIGFQFQQTNDFFEYIDLNYTEEAEDGEIITGPYQIAKYNRYKSFDIPLMVGYEIDINNFTFALNTGIHMNLFYDKSGYILTPDESWSTIQNDNVVYKNWIGTSWVANIGAYFHLNNRTQLMMEPHFKYSLSSMTVKDYPIEQRNFSTGMRLGLRFRM